MEDVKNVAEKASKEINDVLQKYNLTLEVVPKYILNFVPVKTAPEAPVPEPKPEVPQPEPKTEPDKEPEKKEETKE